MFGGVTRLRILPVIFAALILLVPSVVSAETLDELLRQQNELRNQQQQKEQQLKQKESEGQNLAEDIDDLESSIGYTQGRINDTESQISVTSAVIAKLSEEITNEQGTLDKLQERLRVAYVALYQLSRTSPTEMMAQGDDVSDIVSHEMYVQAIQDQLQKDITSSSQLLSNLGQKKTESESQNQDLSKLKNRLAADRTHLDRQRNQKESFLAATQRDQAKLQSDLEKLKSQQENLSAEIYEARRQMGAGETTTGGTGGYPYYNQCGGVDFWLFYKCQCTSYAAWKFLRNTGLVFYNTRPGQGSAWNWPALAADQGYTVSGNPQVGDIVSWPKGNNMPYGHVAIVTAVHGGLIDVDEYNWTAAEKFDHRANVDPRRYGSPSYIRP
ncbi:MAG: CHAP domain-containing protein [Candidatus Berkelbacteria bacterium]|nr:MAG: CHAP domain-containing protein [Candidatus Berkelbacteria bacterium]QQG51865.1 MAG: CHAP domain-containing protein [Candidatus Berkelbacteria bacterium]